MISVVVDAVQTRAVIEEHGGRAPAFMMCSTIAPQDAEAIAEALAERGVDMLDAPISGGPARAHAGTLSMMASGGDAAFARCRPVIDAMAAKCFRLGTKPGDGMFKPKEPLKLGEGAEVRLTVQPVQDDHDPLEAVIGIGESGRPDGAEQHDHYIYGTPKR